MKIVFILLNLSPLLSEIYSGWAFISNPPLKVCWFRPPMISTLLYYNQFSLLLSYLPFDMFHDFLCFKTLSLCGLNPSSKLPSLPSASMATLSQFPLLLPLFFLIYTCWHGPEFPLETFSSYIFFLRWFFSIIKALHTIFMVMVPKFMSPPQCEILISKTYNMPTQRSNRHLKLIDVKLKFWLSLKTCSLLSFTISHTGKPILLFA